MTAAPATAGGGRQMTERPKPCDSWSPHEPGMSARGIRGKPVPVQCNRPSGHSGNHMCLAGNFDRLAEWEQAKVVI